MEAAPPIKATDAVLVASEAVADDVKKVQGIDWMSLPNEQRVIIANFVDQLTGQGFQSSSIGDAIRIINDMVRHCHMRPDEAVLTAGRDHGETQTPAKRQPYFWATLPT